MRSLIKYFLIACVTLPAIKYAIMAVAYNESNRFEPKGIGGETCKEFLHQYSMSELKRTETGYQWNGRFSRYIGFLEGFQTHINSIYSGKYDFFHDDDGVDSFGWIGTWCRENPNLLFYNAIRAYVDGKVYSNTLRPTVEQPLSEILRSWETSPTMNTNVGGDSGSAPGRIRQDPRLSELLARCRVLYEANSLTTGSTGNAFDCYREILSRHPQSDDALKGIQQISDRYLSWFNQAIQARDYNKASLYLSRMELVATNESSIATARRELDALAVTIRQEEILRKQNEAELEERRDREERESIIANNKKRFQEAADTLQRMSNFSPSNQLARLPKRMTTMLVSCYIGSENYAAIEYATNMAVNDDYMARNIIDIAKTGRCGLEPN